MKKSVSKFVSEEDREKIVKAVEEAEKTTSGEIVPMIVPFCNKYIAATQRGAFLLALLVAIAVVYLMPEVKYRYFVPIFLLGMVVFYFSISKISFLQRLFVYAKEKEEEVSEGAMAAFYESGLYRTRDETGVLIFISVFERKVWVLADRGINDKVDPHEWEHIVGDLGKGIKAKRQCEAIVEAIGKIGKLLQDRFPRKDDDTDELSNIIVK